MVTLGARYQVSHPGHVTYQGEVTPKGLLRILRLRSVPATRRQALGTPVPQAPACKAV